MEQAVGVQGCQGLVILSPNFVIIELDVTQGGLRRSMAHHLGQDGQGHATTGHIGAEGVAETVRVGVKYLAGGPMVAEEAAQAGVGHGLTAAGPLQDDEEGRGRASGTLVRQVLQ